MNNKIVGIVWFMGRTQICIVISKDLITEKYRANIACVPGTSDLDDMIYTRDYGMAFPLDEARTIIKDSGDIIDNNHWLPENSDINNQPSQEGGC